MTKRELEAIVELWRGRLGLATWKIEIKWGEPAGDNARASIWRSQDYDEAKLYFGDGWKKRSVRELNQLVVHELLHLVLRDVEFIENLLDGQLHRDVESVIHKTHSHNVEQAVDRLAYRLIEIAGVHG